MSKIKILVVEDEIIVAKDIQNSLIKLGYDVPATASSFASAMEKIEDLRPNLVFLDIKLKGELDGINIAEEIKRNYHIPVIFLTSFVDKVTLDRAKITEPYGYLVKPFNESDLQTTVEMALYKFEKDKEVKGMNTGYASALKNLDESIIIMDTDCRITYLNPKAETVTGYGNVSAQGIDIFMVVTIENEDMGVLNRDQLEKMMNNRSVMSMADCLITIKRTQQTFRASVTSSPIRDEKNLLLGNAFLINEITGKVAPAPAGLAPGQEADSLVNMSLESEIIQNSFFVKRGSMLVKVYLDNVQWIQAMDNYVIIQTNTDQFVIHSTMKDIESKLPSDQFIRVHRSYIVSLDKVGVLDENAVMIGDKTIPIGKSYKDAFMNKLNFL
jgi:PAS domain S-box-containing protein